MICKQNKGGTTVMKWPSTVCLEKDLIRSKKLFRDKYETTHKGERYRVHWK